MFNFDEFNSLVFDALQKARAAGAEDSRITCYLDPQYRPKELQLRKTVDKLRLKLQQLKRALD